MNNQLLALLILGIIVLAACSSNRKKEVDKMPLPDGPQIIFLNYNFSKNTTGQPTVEFINKIITDGKIKKNTSAISNPQIGDLAIIELDQNEKEVAKIFVKNPLSKTVEFANEEGQLSKKQVDVETAQFALRMQLNPLTQSIAIQQLNETDNNNQLTITKIR